MVTMFNPFLGMVLDKVRRNSVFLLSSYILVFISFWYLIMIPNCEKCNSAIAFFPIFGLGYMLFAVSYWPCIRYSVEKEAVTIAYALSYATRSAFNCIAPVFIGSVVDSTKYYYGGYYWGTVTLAGMAFFGIIFSTVVFLVDYYGCRALYGIQ